MSNKECPLPTGTWIARKKGYEEVHVPAIKSSTDSNFVTLKSIDELPEWIQPVFRGMKTLNKVQTRMYNAAFLSHENLLLCAPTGAGKTNVAILTILHEIEKNKNKETGEIDLKSFKIVYIAPMKALVQEIVLNFTSRFEESFGIQVRELSGDQNLSREEIFRTQIIVTTPEKWDIITRKGGDDRSYTQLVRLIIIDEIHLLHDTRGPVLEALVARMHRECESSLQSIRLVGLSATLPNYEDVSTFLHVNPEKGLFYFDSSYRPVPLQQQFIGITEKKALKRYQLMNQICYEKVIEQAGKNQFLIFVHSRKETFKTAKSLRDLALEQDTLSLFLQHSKSSQEILATEALNIENNEELKELLPFGFAIHHAGMNRRDRNLVEELFADKHIQVLVSTSTLAWGVNLPAHSVLIKGTEIYNPEKGKWMELSPLDVIQMLGRAGRPQYDTTGEGIILTSHSNLKFYLSLMNQQLPIESQMVSQLPNHLNAEIVLGTIRNMKDAIEWLSYTFLYIRMLRSPSFYGLSDQEIEKDKTLKQRRLDLIYSSMFLLAKHSLLKLDRRSFTFQSTNLGKVASYYSIVYPSISVYNEFLKPSMGEIELFRLFSLSNEFQFLVVREEEKLELVQLTQRVPLPIKESIEESTAKVNVLLQAYISHLKLKGFALASDMIHIAQNAGRLFRALFDIALMKGYSNVALKILNCCKMVDRRMWCSQTPLRQILKGNQNSLCRKLEKKDIPWNRYLDLNPSDLGQLIHQPKFGKQLYQAVHQIPKLDIQAYVQPITRSTLQVDLSITPDFEYNTEIHGNFIGFWIIVEDVDGEKIVYYQWFSLKLRYATDVHPISFTIPIFDPLPPQYFIRVVADRWISSETSLPISFHHLILPERNSPPIELLDLQPLVLSTTQDRSLYEFYEKQEIKVFNPIQTQTFSKIYETDGNVLLAAPSSSGKTVCAELAILRFLQQRKKNQQLCTSNPSHMKKCVYIIPNDECCSFRYNEWKINFKDFKIEILELTGENKSDIQAFQKGDLILSTPERFEMFSRKWKRLKSIQLLDLFIVDDLHKISEGKDGVALEVVLSRIRYISSQLKKKIRIIALSESVANAKDLADWIGVETESLFNFQPNVRPVPLTIQIHGIDINYYSSRLLAMSKPTYNAIMQNSSSDQVIVFVSSKKQSQITAIDLLSFAIADDKEKYFLKLPETLQEILCYLRSSTSSNTFHDLALLSSVESGVAYLNEETHPFDKKIVLELYSRKVIQVLVCTSKLCWSLSSIQCSLVVVMGTEEYHGREHRTVEYPFSVLYQMMKYASEISSSSNSTSIVNNCQCLIFCHSPRKEFYTKFLCNQPVPVESHLDHYLTDHLNAEIVTKTIETRQDAVDYLTWSFLYRRLVKNPNYYNLKGCSHRHLSDHLSELVETTLTLLEETGCIQIVDDEHQLPINEQELKEQSNHEVQELYPLNLGMIACHYSIKTSTLELFSNSITSKTKLKKLIDILANASEYDDISLSYHEDRLLEKLAKQLTVCDTISQSSSINFLDPHIKVNILLISHFSRKNLSKSHHQDLVFILRHALKLLQGIVDVSSSNGWLKPALASMDLCKMIVQGLWETDSPLLQIPFFTQETVKIIQLFDSSIDSPLDLLQLDEENRSKYLSFSPHELSQIAVFCNHFPDIIMDYEIKKPLKEKSKEQKLYQVYANETIEINVFLKREIDEKQEEINEKEEELDIVFSQFYPHSKKEEWWILLGDMKANLCFSIKRISLQLTNSVKLEFTAPEKTGIYKYQLYLICDSYIGCDQESTIEFQVHDQEKKLIEDMEE